MDPCIACIEYLFASCFGCTILSLQWCLVLTVKVRAVHIRGLSCLMGFWKWASSPSLGDFSPPLFQTQTVVLLWQSKMESCSMGMRISELHRIGWTGARVVHPTSRILKYHSIEITGSKLGLRVMWTLFLSDSLWQMVGVGLGFQDPYPNFHGRSPWGMKRVVRLFLHLCNSFFNPCGRDKGLSSWKVFIWLLALKIPGDPQCALQRPKCRCTQRAYPSNTQDFSTCHHVTCLEIGAKRPFLTCRVRTLLPNSLLLPTASFPLYLVNKTGNVAGDL